MQVQRKHLFHSAQHFFNVIPVRTTPPPAPHSSHPSAGGICIRNSPIPFSSDEHIKYVTIHASEQSNEINIHKSNITCKRRCPFASEPVPVCLCSHSPLWLFHPESSLAHFGSFAVVFWSILARLWFRVFLRFMPPYFDLFLAYFVLILLRAGSF